MQNIIFVLFLYISPTNHAGTVMNAYASFGMCEHRLLHYHQGKHSGWQIGRCIPQQVIG